MKRSVESEMEEYLHLILTKMANLAIVVFEFMGAGVIIIAGVVGIICYIRRDSLTRLKLAKGLAMGLEFKLGSEILRTVVVRDFREITIVGAIIVLRAALTFLIHWEIKTEKEQIETEPELPRHKAENKEQNQSVRTEK